MKVSNNHPRSMTAKIRDALAALKKKPMPDKIRLLVKARLMTAAEAERAIKKLQNHS